MALKGTAATRPDEGIADFGPPATRECHDLAGPEAMFLAGHCGQATTIALKALRDPGCVKTILWNFWRKIDSRGTRLAQQNIVVTVRSILMLRESDCSKRFDTAWTLSEHRA